MGITIFLLLLAVIHWSRIWLLTMFVRVFKHNHIAIWLYAVLFLPGTMVHELAHFFTAALLGLRTGTIALLPEMKENGVRFGSVQVERSDPFRAFLVGIAPTMLGFGLILFLIRQFGSPLRLLYMYLAFSIGSHMLPSRDDLIYFLPFILLLISVGGLWYMIDQPSLYAIIGLIDRTLLNIIRYNN